MAGKVAIVTGGNKGIGFGIVKGLCEKFVGTVYLTARDVSRGKAAVADLKKSGLNAEFYQLDVTDPESVTRFGDYIKEKHGGIDVLVNNAAIAFKNDATESFAIQAKETTFVNYFSLVSTCNILFPLLRDNARVVNLSSSAGHLTRIPGEHLRKKFADPSLTEPALSELIKEFVAAAERGTKEADGWGKSAYSVSKVAVTALTFIQDREYGPKGISINCVHPGYVDTDMTSHKGPFTVERGSLASLYLALEAPADLKGVYMWHDKSIADWFGEMPSNP